jgi:glycosyltransferase involved in cell wall biosynthesis
MKLSIIIPTFNGRVTLLEHTLKSIRRQSTDFDYEILIVNDGTSNNGSKELAEKYNAEYIFSGQRNENGIIKWRSAAWAINLGIRRAKGELILINEPEVYHTNLRHLQKLVDPHLDNKNIASHPEKVLIDTNILLREIENGREPSEELQQQIVNFYHAHFFYSLCLSKQSLLNVNGMDEGFTCGCYDDLLFDTILRNSGVKYHPIEGLNCIHLFHPRASTPNWALNKERYERLKDNVINNVETPNWGINFDPFHC